MREFPGGPVVRTWSFTAEGLGCSIPGHGTKILQAEWHNKNKKGLMISHRLRMKSRIFRVQFVAYSRNCPPTIHSSPLSFQQNSV